MKHRPLKQLCGLIATAAVALVLIGCNGKAGQNGTNGTNGTNGNNGNPGVVTLNVAALTPDEWGNLVLKGSVQSVLVSATAGQPVVNFTVTNADGMPVTGLASFTTKVAKVSSTTSTAGNTSYDIYTKYANVAFTIAKLVPAANGSPSYWENYILNSVPSKKVADDSVTASVPGKPSTDAVGNLVDHGDGTYTYTFSDIRDITKMQGVLDAYTYTGNNSRADLGLTNGFEPNLTHRLVVQISGNARGTSTNTPDGSNTGIVGVPIKTAANIVYDFVPSRPVATQAVTASDAQRQIVDVAACNACHTKLAPHGGARVDTQLCVVCHTDQRKYGNPEATATTTAGVTTYTGNTYKIKGLAAGNLVAFIHRMHMGEGLTNQGYNYANILFNEVAYPQDIRNCQTCHTAQAASTVPDAPPVAPVTAQGDAWKTNPSRLACGSCHDNVDFTVAHTVGSLTSGGAQLSDVACAGCHSAADIAIYHTPVWTPVQGGNNLAVVHGGMQSNSYQATNPANLPKGAHRVDYVIKSVTVSATGIPTIVFQYQVDGVPAVFTPFVDTTTTPEMLTGFVSNSFGASESNGPNLALAVGISQDGIKTPADYNFRASWQIKNIWNGTALFNGVKVGTLSGPAAGFYTIALTGYPLDATKLPAGVQFGAVGMGIGLGMLTQTDLHTAADAALINHDGTANDGKTMDFTFVPSTTVRNTGGLIIPSKMKWATAPVVTTGNKVPNIQRRTILREGSCNSCHGTLGAFTARTSPANFHGVGIGDANAEQSCVFCHNTTGVDSSAWSYDTKTWVHALHSANKPRNNAFTAHSGSGSDFWNIQYPGLLNNCEACHVPGSYDFSNAANAAQLPSMLWETVASGTLAKVIPTYPLFPNANYPAVTLPTSFVIPTTLTPALWVTGQPKYVAPFIDQTAFYGTNVAITAPTSVGGNWTVVPPAIGPSVAPAANPKWSLVVSPITGACSACHDSASAIAHFKGNGGAFYEERPTGFAKTEQCLVCHGNGKVADIRAVHLNFK
jgi:OmcA/MtrC family decaheme c-type cytochrome